MEAIAIVIVSYTIMGAVHKPCLRPSTQQVIQKNWASTSTKVGIVVSHSTWKVTITAIYELSGSYEYYSMSVFVAVLC